MIPRLHLHSLNILGVIYRRQGATLQTMHDIGRLSVAIQRFKDRYRRLLMAATTDFHELILISIPTDPPLKARNEAGELKGRALYYAPVACAEIEGQIRDMQSTDLA